MKVIKRNIYPIVVFITGACVLVIELVALRILSPFFGGTLYSTTSVITVILTALSFGYYVGGRYSDKHPEPKPFYLFIAISGLLTLALYFLSFFILPFAPLALGITWGPLLMATILFFAPAFFWGMLSPYAITLESKKKTKKEIGSVSGRVFFASTAGSICGSLLTGFFLVPRFGVNSIMLSVSVILVLLGLIGGFKSGFSLKKTLVVLSLLVAFFYLSLIASNFRSPSVLYDTDGIYERIRVVEQEHKGVKGRLLRLDASASSGIEIETGDLLFTYTKYADLYKYTDIEVKDTLVLGAGAYTIPDWLTKNDENILVDAVDIEPTLYEIGKEYFGVSDTKRITPIVSDGRTYVNSIDKKYDYVYLDMFASSLTPPEHLMTTEFYESVKNVMQDNSIIIVNAIGNPSDGKPNLLLSEIKTMESVFDDTYYFTTDDNDHMARQNYIFVAFNGDVNWQWDESEQSEEFLSHLIEEEYDLDGQIVFTDDYAPVEWLGAKMVVKR